MFTGAPRAETDSARMALSSNLTYLSAEARGELVPRQRTTVQHGKTQKLWCYVLRFSQPLTTQFLHHWVLPDSFYYIPNYVNMSEPIRNKKLDLTTAP
jgi:hypothetical protein